MWTALAEHLRTGRFEQMISKEDSGRLLRVGAVLTENGAGNSGFVISLLLIDLAECTLSGSNQQYAPDRLNQTF